MRPVLKLKNAYVDEVIQQAVKKKIVPAIERRIRTELTEVAEDGAIQLFSENLRNLLLIPPLKAGAWSLDLTQPFGPVLN